MATGRRRKPDQDVKSGHFTTVDKDGRVVWEPGLPSQVMSRRAPRAKQRNEKEDMEEGTISCDLKVTLRLSPDAQAEWLQKALKAIPKGLAKAQDVYNIVTSPKFASGVSNRLGLRMLQQLQEARGLFSEKQQLALVRNCELARRFRVRSGGSDSDSTDEEEYARRRRKLEEAHRLERKEAEAAAASAAASAALGVQPPAPAIPEPVARAAPLHAQAPRSSAAARSEGGTQQEARPRPEVAAEEAERLHKEFQEKERQREDDRRRVLAERKAVEEREKKRRAKLGAAFLMGDEEEDEQKPLPPHSLPPQIVKGREERKSLDERSHADMSLNAPLAMGEMMPRAPRHSASGNSHMVEAMGGEKVLREVHAMLMQKVGPEGRSAKEAARSRSRSRTRERRRVPAGNSSATSDPHRPEKMVGGTMRSPTPDGHKRGQMRAARKAKMIAACLGLQR